MEKVKRRNINEKTRFILVFLVNIDKNVKKCIIHTQKGEIIMEVINLSSKKLASLPVYNPGDNIVSSESIIYVYKSSNILLLLKKFFITEGLSFGNKLLTINTLIDNATSINIPELVLPQKLLVVGDEVCGFSMELIDSINMHNILCDSKVSLEDKINFLKQIGKIIERVNKTKVCAQSFHLGDIHEANFILEKKTMKVRAVDLDSSKIVNNNPFPIKYMCINNNLSNLRYKYPVNDEELVIPNYNSELFCYITMILNTISNSPIYRLSIEEYYSYLQYLRDLGLSNEILDCFYKIYTGASNLMPLELLDQIPKKFYQADYKVYKARNKIL